MGIIGTLIIIVLVVAVFKAIAETEKGGFILLVMPLILLAINFTIGWENYWNGVPFPNPIDPGGLRSYSSNNRRFSRFPYWRKFL